ncbi:hypothetical protein K413DRAFT_4672 [Clostridium sp. ASBs410]|nr:hypothetical protein K413DRAFT_4672 [Clostridium sp. ASBs410]
MMGYIPVFEEGDSNTLLLDHSFYDECLEYADAHKLNVLYTDTTCTGSVETIMEFKKRGYSYKLYEVPQFAPGGLKLSNKIYCKFTR